MPPGVLGDALRLQNGAPVAAVRENYDYVLVSGREPGWRALDLDRYLEALCRIT